MNLKVNKEPVRFTEKICGCTQEQSIELDYVLPDYYPEIFRIIKCCAESKITSCAANGDRITYELTVCLKIIYCSENSSRPEAIDQKLVYSRTVNLDRSVDSPSVYISAEADHINCRAVNRRRIDIRGAVTISISAFGDCETDVVSEVFGGNIQLKTRCCPCPSSIIRTSRRVTVSDEFDLGADAPPIGSILRASAEIVSSDKKTIASKVAAKGELKISIAYVPAGGEDSNVCCMQFSMPFSQLVELEGMDDTYDCRISSSVISCDIIPRSEGDGESRSIECEVLLFIDCTAVRMSSYSIACDEYSTSHSSSHTCTSVKTALEPVNVESSLIVKGICENKDSPISVVYDAWCTVSKLRAVITDGKAMAVGTAVLSVMGRTESGDFIICETDVPIEEDLTAAAGLDGKALTADADIRLVFSVISCGYTISDENKAEIKAEVAARGQITGYDTVEAITDIAVDEDSPREKNDEYALRLYFAEEGEELWGIAKRYGAAISRVIEENELDGDVIREGRMLLIPIA